jgi:hypothetical protein
VDEISATRDALRRDQMLAVLKQFVLHQISDEARSLAARYLDAGVIPASVPEDALHVAIAVLTRQDVLVSWNFKHLVNMRRRAAVVAMNASLGLPTIQIIAPPEL